MPVTDAPPHGITTVPDGCTARVRPIAGQSRPLPAFSPSRSDRAAFF